MQLWISEKSIRFRIVRKGEVEEKKNKEKYTKEIIEIVCVHCNFGVNKYTRKPVSCNDLYCSECLLNEMNSRNCHDSRYEWAESEYIEHSVISKKDKAFLEYLREEYKYIARDKNDILYAYKSEPLKKGAY